MGSTAPREVYDARLFWVVKDVGQQAWITRPGADCAQRRPYYGDIRELHRVDHVTEHQILHRLDASYCPSPRCSHRSNANVPNP